ncbi:MAG TPA: hypothetical protein VMV10_29040 [Pirellulales bacterium]|nr:hypothetical protein [Pirellulales bacterium]
MRAISGDEVAAQRTGFRGARGLGEQALEDLGWIIEHEPEQINLDRVRELRDTIERSTSQK